MLSLRPRVQQLQITARSIKLSPSLVPFDLLWGWLLLTLVWRSAFVDPNLNSLDFRLAGDIADIFILVLTIHHTKQIAARLPQSFGDALRKWLLYSAAAYLIAALVSGPGPQGRYAAFSGGPNVFVRIMGLGALAAFYSILKGGNLLIYVPLSISFISGALLSGSRGGAISLAITAVLYFGLTVQQSHMRTRLKVIVILSVLLVLVPVALNLSAFSAARYRYVGDGNSNTSSRTELATDAIQQFKDYPVFGGGFGSFAAAHTTAEGSLYVHNLPLAFAAESGLVGIILLLGSYIFLLVSCFQRPMTLDQRAFIMYSLLIVVASQFSGDYYDSRFAWWFLILAVTCHTNTPPSLPAAKRSLRLGRT